MIPLHFGAPERPLLGYLHPSRAGTTARAAIALCAPLGWEAIASHFALRTLADELAADGFDVLRFDYDGTGDSFGDDDEPDRVEGWLGSVESALELLKSSRPGVPLSVVGLHLGATFGAHVAARRGDVASAVLWAPFAQGRAFVRQVKAYRALNPSQGAKVAEGDEEAAGFYLSAQTVKALSSVSLLQSASSPAPQVLLLGRTKDASEDALAEHWRKAGASVESAALDGYVDLMQEPRKSVLPTEVFARIRAFLSLQHPHAVARHAPQANLQATVALEGVEETAGFFGSGDELFGLLTRPVSPPTRATVVFLNTASDPRVGPNRMYVRWARALARRGHASFRFDPRGVGDCRSPDSPSTVHVYSNRRLTDLREVFAHLKRLQVPSPYILMGLCSGAYGAFHGALDEPQVASIVMLNPQTFQWREGDSLEIKMRDSFKSTRFYKRAVLRKETWQRALRGEVNVRGTLLELARRSTRGALRELKSLVPFGNDEELFVERGFKKLLARGTRVFLLFGANDGGIDAVEAHLGPGARRLKRFGGLTFEVTDGPDHTFSQVMEQRRLYDRVLTFLDV